MISGLWSLSEKDDNQFLTTLYKPRFAYLVTAPLFGINHNPLHWVLKFYKWFRYDFEQACGVFIGDAVAVDERRSPPERSTNEHNCEKTPENVKLEVCCDDGFFESSFLRQVESLWYRYTQSKCEIEWILYVCREFEVALLFSDISSVCEAAARIGSGRENSYSSLITSHASVLTCKVTI